MTPRFSRISSRLFRAGAWTVAAGLALLPLLAAGTLSDPAVDRYNLRVGTQTFNGQYQFTTNTLLVETAEAIRVMGSDIVKLYLGRDFERQYHVALPATITSLTALVRDEPSCRRVFDLPFRYYLVWAYSFTTGPDAYWLEGLTPAERQREYAEMYALARHLLTAYDGSGKRFFLGHWEGDWYLLPNYQTATNPSPTAIQGMRDWLNTRQQAVDDARRDTPHADVDVFLYAEVNRVRDAMLNGPNSNQRLVNTVLPAVTNLDYVSWSSYDGQDLAPADLSVTLDYIQSKLSTNKAAAITGRRVFIGEYGWGGSLSSAAQESRTRAYLRSLLGWGTPFNLFWQIYNNEPGKAFWLIDSAGQRTPCYELHARFLNAAKLLVGEFNQNRGRLPDVTEYGALVTPMLNAPLQVPVSLSLTNLPATNVGSDTATLSGTLRQGIYGEPRAQVFVCWGTTDGGTSPAAWQQAVDLGTNSRFGAVTISTTLAGLEPARTYFFRFHAANGVTEGWSASSATFTTVPKPPCFSKVQAGPDWFALWVEPGASVSPLASLQLEASTNLSDPRSWMTVHQTNGDVFFSWLDPGLSVWPQRFYRAVRVP
jgi:hypothetical protein